VDFVTLKGAGAAGEVAPSPVRPSPSHLRPQADPREAAGAGESDLDPLLATEAFPEAGRPGEALDRRALTPLHGQLEALAGPRRGRRREGADEGLRPCYRPHQVDDRVPALHQGCPLDPRLPCGQHRADRRPVHPDIAGSEGEIHGHPAERSRAERERHREGIGQREGAEVAPRHPHPHRSPDGGAVVEVDHQGTRRALQIDHLQARPPTCRRGREHDPSARAPGGPSGEEPAAVGRRRPGYLPPLHKDVRSVIAVEEGARWAGRTAGSASGGDGQDQEKRRHRCRPQWLRCVQGGGMARASSGTNEVGAPEDRIKVLTPRDT